MLFAKLDNEVCPQYAALLWWVNSADAEIYLVTKTEALILPGASALPPNCLSSLACSSAPPPLLRDKLPAQAAPRRPSKPVPVIRRGLKTQLEFSART